MTDGRSPSATQAMAMFRLALLASAWDWGKEEAARAVGMTPVQIDRFKTEPGVPADIAETIARLFRLQYHLWSTRPFGDYAGWWRRPWDVSSPIGARSPLEAVIADGRSAIDRIIALYDAMQSGDFT